MSHSLQRWLFCLAAASLLPCAACQRGATPDAASQTAPASNVAVVDLDEIAKRLGRDVEMNDAVQSAANSLNQQLTTVRGQLQEQFDRKLQQSLGVDSPHSVAPASAVEPVASAPGNAAQQLGKSSAADGSPASASSVGGQAASQLAASLPPNELQAMKRPFDVQFAQYQAQARDKLAAHRASVVERFKREVRPVAERVAARRGATVVVTKNDSVVFAVTPAADITEDVVREMQELQFARPKTESAAAAKSDSNASSAPN